MSFTGYTAKQLEFKFANEHWVRGKVRAIRRYSKHNPSDVRTLKRLNAIRECIGFGFIKPVEQAFLDHALDETGIEWTFWAYKTRAYHRYLQSLYRNRALREKREAARAKAQQLYFEFKDGDRLDMRLAKKIMPHLQSRRGMGKRVSA